MNRTLFDKIWAGHVIVTSPQGEELLISPRLARQFAEAFSETTQYQAFQQAYFFPVLLLSQRQYSLAEG